MSNNDAGIASAKSARSGDKFAFAQHEEQSAHETGGPHPGHGGDDDDDYEDTILQPRQLLLAQKCAEQYQHEDGGKGQEGVRDAHESRVDHAAVVTGKRADNNSKGDG